MKTLHAVLVDDEPAALEGLTELLKLFCPGVSVIGTAASAIEGVKLVRARQPDLLFLDVEMPGGSGFDLLDAVDANSCTVIFVTAHSDYTIRALRTGAVDYLLKPVSPAELKSAVARAVMRREQASANKSHRVRVSGVEGIRFLPADEIIGIEADGRYSVIHTVDRNKLMVSRNIGDFEKELDPHGFFRIHKSWLINCLHVVRMVHADGGAVQLRNGKEVSMSRRKKTEFLRKMEA